MKLFLFFTTLLTCSITEAQSLTTDLMLVPDKQEKRIHEGDMSIGGGINFGYASYVGFITEGSPSFEYFLLDRFSLGASIPFSFHKGYDSVGIGPSATFHFWEGDKWTAYFNQKILIQNARYMTSIYDGEDESVNTTYIDGTSALGMQYFFNPHVALGGELSHTYNLDDSDRRYVDNLNLGFSFKFFF